MPSSGHLGRTGAAPAGVDSDQTLGRVLRERAEHDGFIFLSYQRAEAFEEERLTYGALFERAKAIAATLQFSGARGDRVLILCPQGSPISPPSLPVSSPAWWRCPSSLGIDSLAAAQLTASVERALGVTLDAEDKMVAQERVEVPPPNDLSDLTDAQVLERASKYLEGAQ